MSNNKIFEYGGKAVNKNTAMAMSGGTNYEPQIKETEQYVLFKIKPLMPEKPIINLPEITEMEGKFVGKRRGRLVVTGWFGSGRWLCRCDCGYYTVRKISFLKKQHAIDACVECLFVMRKRKQANYLATGRDSDVGDYA
jgi:hypothetical protein